MMSVAPSILAGERAEPVGAREFAALIMTFAPFEAPPHLAVAVSGGSDSMALALLAAGWARAQGGQVTALTVDHGLRAEAAAEARQVGSWCAARGFAHEILRWHGPAPGTGIQAAARAARYGLLEAWCRAQGVLHLLVAHQREDQAETLLMRLTRASGVDGLSGMAALVERGAMRVLRPLLTLPRARLQATLRAAAQDWIEDPSNRNPAFLRARLRVQLDSQAGRGVSAERLASLAAQFGRARAALEIERARLLARSVVLHPPGFAWLNGAALLAAPEEVALRALAAVITTVSGADYPPRSERLERLFRLLPQGLASGRTLGGCLILPRRGRILICRELAAVAAPVLVAPRGVTRWDGRFNIELTAPAPGDLWLGALGEEARAVINEAPATVLAAVPPLVRPTLPALRDAEGVVGVQALGYFAQRREAAAHLTGKLLFCPTRPLTSGGFRIV
jgi:tRNA(Ile)-lysidine synthase